MEAYDRGVGDDEVEEELMDEAAEAGAEAGAGAAPLSACVAIAALSC